MSLKLRHWPSDYGGCCFEIVLPSGQVLVIDPYRIEATGFDKEVSGADYIALTHNTHMGVRDCVPLSQRFNGRIICSYDAADTMREFSNVNMDNVIPVTAGNTIVFDDLKVEVKRAKHPSMIVARNLMQKARLRNLHRQKMGKEASHKAPGTSLASALQSRAPTTPEDKDQQKKQEQAMGFSHRGEHLNFVFQTSDNMRIYLYQSGTYDFLRHEIIEAHPNIFIAQCHPGNDAAELAEFAALSGAEIVIPYGYQLRDDQPFEIMAKHLAENKSQAHLLDIVYQQWYEIGVKTCVV